MPPDPLARLQGLHTVRLQPQVELAGPYERVLRRPNPEVEALGRGQTVCLFRAARLWRPVPLVGAGIRPYYMPGQDGALDSGDFSDAPQAEADLQGGSGQVRYLAVPWYHVRLPRQDWVGRLAAAVTPWTYEALSPWVGRLRQSVWLTVVRVYRCRETTVSSEGTSLTGRIRPLVLRDLELVLDEAEFAGRCEELLAALDAQRPPRSGLASRDEPPPEDRAPQPSMPPEFSLQALARESGWSHGQLAQWVEIWRRKRQMILAGPPGTGKTFVARLLARHLSGGGGCLDTVQFHPAYAYEDFVQGIRPRGQGAQLSYGLEDGLFLRFCRRAARCAPAPCALVIDEINRAQLAAVFGELMYLLEYRDEAVQLAAGGPPFSVPPNVFLLGTMNTADRSTALVDRALLRRFALVRLPPAYKLLAAYLQRHGLPAAALVDTLKEINAAIDDADTEVGISAFMQDGSRLRQTLPLIWRAEIEPYLAEVFYDRPERLDAFAWPRLAASSLQVWTDA